MGTIISHVYVLFLLQLKKEKEKSGKYLKNTIQLAEEYGGSYNTSFSTI